MNPHLLTHETADDYVRGMARVTQLVAQHLAAVLQAHHDAAAGHRGGVARHLPPVPAVPGVPASI